MIQIILATVVVSWLTMWLTCWMCIIDPLKSENRTLKLDRSWLTCQINILKLCLPNSQVDLYSQLATKHGLTRDEVKKICFPIAYGGERGNFAKRCEQMVQHYVRLK